MKGLKKDPILERGCVIPAGLAIAFFVYLALDDPRGWGVSLKYIAAIMALLVATAAWGRRTPYARAAVTFARGEVERIRRAMGQRLDSLHLLTPRDFEFALGRLFEGQGWQVEVTAHAADGGKDLILRRNNATVLVEVKQFASENKVGRPLIMKLHSAVVHERADAGIFVTTSYFTEPAREFAELNQIQLIDAPRLAGMLLDVFPAQDSPQLKAMCGKCGVVAPYCGDSAASQKCACGHELANPIPPNLRVPEATLCPNCNAEMARLRVKGTRYHRFKCPVCQGGIVPWDK